MSDGAVHVLSCHLLCSGIPLELIKPEALGAKVFEPLLLLGKQRWGFLDIRLRVKGGGHVSQVYGEQCRLGGWGLRHVLSKRALQEEGT